MKYTVILAILVAYQYKCAHGQFPVDMNTIPSHFYDFGPVFGDTVAPVNDDGSTGRLQISIAFPFYNHVHDSLFVSTNGVVSFLREVRQFTPDDFPLGDGRRMIAPYWSDVDTSGHGGRIYYHEYYGTDEHTLLSVRQKAQREVQDAFSISFTPDWVFVATWYRVACYGGCTVENTFQAALITDGIKSFVSFHYGDMTWTAGTASGADVGTGRGGTPAVVGFNAGDNVTFAVVPESRTEDIINVASTSNVGVPGVWMFRVDTDVLIGECSNDATGTLQILPRFGNLLGGKKVTIRGPCFNETHVIQCKFGNIVVDGRMVDEQKAECVAPFMGTTGTFPLTISLNGGQDFIYEGQFIYVTYDPSSEVVRKSGDGWMVQNSEQPLPFPGIHWTVDHLNTSHVNIAFVMFSYDENRVIVSTEVLIKSNEPNTRNQRDLHAFTIITLEAEDLPSPSFGAIRVSPATVSDQDVEYLWSDIIDPGWYLKHFYEKVASNNLQGTGRKKREIAEDIEDAWNEISDFFNNVGSSLSDIKDKITKKIEDMGESYFSARCDEWVTEDNKDPPDFSDLPPPPCTLDQARNDPDFMADPACNEGNGCELHLPDAYHCVRSRTPSANGASQQACYSESGELLPFERGGGTVDRSGASSVINHFLDDVKPYYLCCKWSSNCDKYSQQRPTQDCSDYVPPVTGTGFGDPHIFTLDGFGYTFNGKGEYVLLHIPSNNLMVQARTTQAVNGTGYPLLATEWSALAMKLADSSTIQIHVNEIRGLDALIDGVRQEFDDIVTEITFNGGSISQSKQGNSTVLLISFPGAAFQIKSESRTRLSFVTQFSNTLKGSTSGLLGVWNDDKTDDLLASDGTTLDDSSSQETIFREFGESWRVSESTSLFHYELQTYAILNDLTFTPVFLSEDDLQSEEAIAVCGDNQQCLFDFFASGGDTDFALQTKQNEQIYKTILQNTQPVVTCGFPIYPANANITGGGSLVGAVVQFTCKDGYTLHGSSSITCQEDGKWTSQSPVCEELSDDISSDISSVGVLIMSISGGFTGVLLIIFFVVLLHLCNNGNVHRGRGPYKGRPQGLHINTGIPTSNTGYVGPYPYYMP